MPPPVSYKKPGPEIVPVLEGQPIFEQPVTNIHKELGQTKNISQPQIVEQNESTISPQEEQPVQENVQTDQQNNSSQDQQNDLFEEPEILLPQECFVERCDQIITGRQLEWVKDDF